MPSTVRQRKPGQTPDRLNQAETSAREGRHLGGSTEAQGPDKGKHTSEEDAIAWCIDAEKKKVISPELRDLLQREVYYKLDKSEVKKHGGGVGS
jgi:hypothetical protein